MKKNMPITTAVEHQDIAEQNEVVANSSGPLDAAAGSQLIVTSGVDKSASDAGESPTQGTSDVGNALAAAGSVGESSDSTGLAADTKAANEEALLGDLSDAVEKDMLSRPAGDLSNERSMLAAIKGFRAAFAVKYDHLLTGMANSTAEALLYLGEAEIHLADHIAQQDTPKVGE